MATSGSKVDLTLDEIIKLGKRGRGRGRGQRGARQQSARGLSKWSNQGRGGQQSSVAAVRTRAQQRAQQLRQKARQTLANKRRSLKSDEITQDAGAASLSVKQRLGVGRGQRGRGRGFRIRGIAKANVGKQSSAAMTSQDQPSTSTPRIKIIRIGKSLRGRGGARGRGRGRGGSGPTRQLQQIQQVLEQPVGTRGRGRGRGRGGRGRTPQKDVGSSLHISVPQPSQVQFEPVGIELPPDFAATHATTRSLDARFSPQVPPRPTQRVVQGERSVNYDS